MIPQKLQLKNFLSYGPTIETVDFSSYSLICLSGKNGHGKSALLDAMTWALWGQARKTAGSTKADQGLLRLGQTQMLVIFDFEFNGKQYRIRREYMETYGKPIASLEFGMVDQATETFIPLTDKTIRATQEKIEQTLRLDFDSFCNSAFIRQGNSNEFSKKSPKDRKQILATILGLDQYEVIRKLALEKIKDAWAKKNVLTTLQSRREQELSAQEELTAQLIIITQEMKLIDEKEKEWKKTHSSLSNEKKALDAKQKEFNLLSYQLTQLHQQKEAQHKTLKNIVTQWRTINAQKKSLHNNAQLEQEKRKINARIAQHQKQFQRNLECKEAILNLTQEMNTIEQLHKDEYTKKNQLLLIELERLSADHKNSKNSIKLLEQHYAQTEKEASAFTAQIHQLQKEIAAQSITTCKPETIAAQESHLEKRKSAYQHFVSLGNWINAELNSIAQKKKLVHEDDPSCPLCEQNLSASRKRFLKNNFDKTESFLAHRLHRLKRIIPALKEILIEHHALLKQTKEKVQHIETLTNKINELLDAQAKINSKKVEITESITTKNNEIYLQAETIALQQKNIAQLPQYDQLHSDTNYQLLLQKKELLQTELSQNIYNPQEYQETLNQLAIIEKQLADCQALHEQVENQAHRMQQVQALCAGLKQLKKDTAVLQSNISALSNLNDIHDKIIETEKLLELEYTTIKNNKEELLHKKGSTQQKQNYLTAIAQEYQQEQKNLTLLDATIEDYQTIATATGKDGIQALLIEDTIPEIEQEANYLLSRLTNNQAQIFIESLRDLKKGGTKETLDIKISDQAGIRPYELFSGGEAFRIDFALRIAISKLLARRAGTALQTLIIDEGFGSQDEEGLSHIMDALHKIQDDFSKIIIVSHLPAMKDQFPVQFFVEKGIQGSTVNIIEQG